MRVGAGAPVSVCTLSSGALYWSVTQSLWAACSIPKGATNSYTSLTIIRPLLVARCAYVPSRALCTMRLSRKTKALKSQCTVSASTITTLFAFDREVSSRSTSSLRVRITHSDQPDLPAEVVCGASNPALDLSTSLGARGLSTQPSGFPPNSFFPKKDKSPHAPQFSYTKQFHV